MLIPYAAWAEELGFPFISSLPPVKLGGSVAYTFRTQQSGETPREYGNLVTGSILGASYIWQPWFTTVDGNLNLTQEMTTGGTSEADSLVATGYANLNVLPLSNFPTSLSYLRSDSTTDGTLFTSQTTTQRASIRNRLYFPDPRLTISTTGALENTERLSFGEEDALMASVDVNKGFETSTVNAILRHDQSTFTSTSATSTGSDRVNDLANFRHDYQPFENIYVQSSSTVLKSEETVQNADRSTFFIQGVTSGQWRPGEIPVTVNGALRTLTQALEVASSTTDTQSLAGTVGANYVIAPRLTTNVGLNGNFSSVKTSAGAESGETSASDSQTQDATASAGINYNSLDTELAGFSWNWNTAAQSQAGYSSQGEGTQNVAGSLGHNASRPLDIPLVGPSLFSASQQGRASFSLDGEPVPSVSHNASLTRSFSESRVRTFVRLSATDTRDLAGDEPTSFQLLAAQLNRTATIDATSDWQASMSMQMARQTFGDRDSGLNTTAVGSASYFEREVFGFRNLGFRSELIVNGSGFGTSDENDRLSERIDSQWNNQLEYRIGKIIVTLQARAFRNHGELGNAAFLRVLRRFD